MHYKHQMVCCAISIAVILFYALFTYKGPFVGLFYGFLTLPIMTIAIFNFAGWISWKIHGREFRPTWRGARFFNKTKKASDYFLSFSLLMLQFCWIVAFAALGFD